MALDTADELQSFEPQSSGSQSFRFTRFL